MAIGICAVALFTVFVPKTQASSVGPIDFETYTLGNINLQAGWSNTAWTGRALAYGGIVTTDTDTISATAPLARVYAQEDFAAFDGVGKTDIPANQANGYTLSSGITATYTGSNTIKLTGYAPIVTPWFGQNWTTYNYVTVGIKLPDGFSGTSVYDAGVMRYGDDGISTGYLMGTGSTALATDGAAKGYLDYSFAANSNHTKKDGLVKLEVIWTQGATPEYLTIDITGLQLAPSDVSALTAEIDTANATLVGVTEGTVTGNHIVGSSATLTTAITAAQAVTNADVQSVVDAATATLTSAVSTFNAAIASGGGGSLSGSTHRGGGGGAVLGAFTSNLATGQGQVLGAFTSIPTAQVLGAFTASEKAVYVAQLKNQITILINQLILMLQQQMAAMH